MILENEPEQDASEPEQEAKQVLPVETTPEPVEVVAPVKKVRKQPKLTDEELEKAVAPRPSLWPFALAFAMIIMFMGLIIHPIVLGLGVLLVVATVIGWALERRA